MAPIEAKILKAKCKKTGRYYGLELRRVGSDWKVANMVWLNDDESKIIASEVRQPKFYTNSNLRACKGCGTREISSCSCLRKSMRCSSQMDYKLDCIYCDQLEIDYSRPTLTGGPYTKWAGQSNIPDAIKDRYGNPQGSEYDLAQDGAFNGYTIVLLNLCNECNFDMPRRALEKKGFKIVEYKSMASETELRSLLNNDKSQLWVVAHRTGFMNYEHVRIIENYFNSGHGIYIWSDNDPYYVDSNLILSQIFKTRMSGNYYGDHVLGIQQRLGQAGIIANHPITTGIVSFYEGITISNVEMHQGLAPLIYSSDGKIVTAYYDQNQKRALVDGGFTRLWYKWDSAGTDRYIVNAAAWLANIEHFGYMQ